MEYKVVSYFEDLQDDRFAYHVGDKFPRGKKSVSEERIAELLGKNNKQGKPLIEEVITVKAERKRNVRNGK